MHLDVILIIDMKSLHMVLNRVIQFESKFVIMKILILLLKKQRKDVVLATKNYQIKLNSGVSPQSTEDNSLSTMSKVSLGVQFWSENFSSIEGTCALFFIFIGIYYLLYWWCCDPS